MFAKEPLWVDLSSVKDRRELDASNPVLMNSVAQIAAPIRGLEKDSLVGEHIRYLRRTRRLIRLVVTALASLLVMAGAAGVVAVEQARTATAQRNAAVLERDIATSRQLAANAELAAATDPQLAALLSVAAYRIHDTAEARTSMVHQLAKQSTGQASIERYLSAHLGGILSISFSSDGQTLAAAGERVVLWDWHSGTQRATLPVQVNALTFSPNGRLLAVESGDTVTLWDITRQTQVGEFPGRDGRIPIAFSPDGSLLAIGGIDFTSIAVWNIAQHTRVASLVMPPSPDSPPEGLGTTSLAFSPDGRLLAANATYHDLAIFSIPDGSPISTLGQPGTPCEPISIAFSPDHQTIAAGCSVHSAAITIWDAVRRTVVARLQGDGDIDSLTFNRTGNVLLSGDATNHVTMWDMAKLIRIQTLTSHTDAVNAVEYSPDGQFFASASSDSNVIVWKVGGTNPLVYSRIATNGTPVAFDPSGRLLAIANPSAAGTAVVEDVTRGTEVATIHGSGVPVGFVDPDRLLMTDGTQFTIWTFKAGTRLSSIHVPPAEEGAGRGPYDALPIALSRDGQQLATVTGDGTTLVVWDINKDSPVRSFSAPHGVSSLAFGPGARTLAVGEGGGPITIWNLSTGHKVGQMMVDTLGGQVVTVAMSEDGHVIASLQPAGQPQTSSGCFGCEVDLWDADHGTQIGKLSGHTAEPDSVAVDPDGQMLASTAGAETIIWSLPQRAPIATLTGTTGPAIFSPDGRQLATGNAEGGVLVWDTDPQSWLHTLCAIAGRELTPAEWNTYIPGRSQESICGK
jgi:WD40 repeat protein